MKLQGIQQLFIMFRKIFCVCRCGGIFRLSDAQIVNLNKQAPRDWLSDIDSEINRLERVIEAAQERFDVKANSIRERQRRAAERQCMSAVENVIPKFSKLGIETKDVRAIFSPVQFVAFDGLGGGSDGEIERICFIDNPAVNKRHEAIQKDIMRVVKRGLYSWVLLRISDDGQVTKEKELTT